ncbi:Uncharacterised protein [Yersinia pseudotuberculosis]|uniref:hypothetical protein n=1 Tax=Yersinia pseudotuberculosis TaxID=633 RepID=UPI0005DC7364|nr:hypothetical protein [Yersinia pseudotuberculosis]CNL19359.1 Uncharacterised protein [Yersinia pseudotuberculosis]
MSENTDYDKACREIARIAAALGIVDYSGDTSEIFDAILIKDEKLSKPVVLPPRYSFECGVCADINGDWLELNDVKEAICGAGFTVEEE